MHDPIGRALMLRILPCAARGISPYFPAALHAHRPRSILSRISPVCPCTHRAAARMFRSVSSPTCFPHSCALFFIFQSQICCIIHCTSHRSGTRPTSRCGSHHMVSEKSSFSVATRSHPINLSSLFTLQIVRHFHPYHAHAFGVTFHQNSKPVSLLERIAHFERR